ncbi:P-loop containing nucleoside triphosphate hydrolase protein [Cladorrhinum sp. PSN332]|nr:P-loop containing nucleoside triphosphate hydrolase protein [Cladorrhinum sp. PSN332]
MFDPISLLALAASSIVGGGYLVLIDENAKAWRKIEEAEVYARTQQRLADGERLENEIRRLELEVEAGRLRTFRELGVPPDRDISCEDIRAARTEVGYEADCRNIVMVGNRGAGKSTIINCLRGLGPRDSNLAEVGEVNTTLECRKYNDLVTKGGKQIVLYDMPGAGVTSCTAWDYYYSKKLYCFDTVVIAHETTLTESDVRLRRLCSLRGQQCVLVRTKADQHIDNISYRKQLSMAAARKDYMNQVHQDVDKFNELDSARGPGELRVEIKDHLVNQRTLLWQVTQTLRSDRSWEPPAGDQYQVIDEASLLQQLGIMSEKIKKS